MQVKTRQAVSVARVMDPSDTSPCAVCGEPVERRFNVAVAYETNGVGVERLMFAHPACISGAIIRGEHPRARRAEESAEYWKARYMEAMRS